MTRTTRLAAIALTAAALVGSAFAQDARVRVVHASPDTPAVDVLVNDSLRLFEGAEFGQATGYAQVPASVYNAKVVPEGAGPEAAAIDADLNLQYYQSYTVVALGLFSDIAPKVLVDDFSPILNPRAARVRFLHASPDAPAVDIAVSDGPVLFGNVPFSEARDYIDVPGNTMVTLEVRLAGTDTVVKSFPGVMFRPGTYYTVYAIGLAGGSPALDALVTEDARAPIIAINPSSKNDKKNKARGRR